MFLRTPRDRLVALRRTTSAAQVLLARAMVLKAIALLSLRSVPDLCPLTPSILILCFLFSESSFSLAAGLEGMGLSDVRLIVKLMCLCASGRLAQPQGGPDSQLGCLSAAVGALVQGDPNASRLLTQLCTQVKLAPQTSSILFNAGV